jgi:UDP-glucuronate 4-epimerase
MALLAKGQPVLVLDNFNSFYDPALKRANVAAILAQAGQSGLATIIEGDIRDAALVEQIFSTHNIRRVAHMAALANVRASIEQAPLYVEVNVGGSLTLLEAARKHGLEIFVQASTGSVYGETKRIPFVEEDSADRPLASYPASKRAAELLAHTYHHLFGLNITCLRFFNVYGPHGRPDMMPLRVMNALVEGTPITIYGNGDLRRDWTYIDDVVDGVMAALEKPLGYEVINLGYGAPISINSFVDILEEYSGKTAQRQYVPPPPSELPITFCDNARARRLLGFNPQTPIHEGLAKTWAWYTSQANRK